jgi:hypothetical protein
MFISIRRIKSRSMPAGKLPVVAAVIDVEQQGSQAQGGQPRALTGNLRGAEMPSISAGPPHRLQMVSVTVTADEAHLQAAVPLLPQKARTKVPLLLHAAQVRSHSLLRSTVVF